MDPTKNVNALLLGTGEFSFSEGATSAADAIAKGYVDFGNITAFTPSLTMESQEHLGSYRGVRRVDKTASTKSAIEYSLKCDEWSPTLLKVLFGGDMTPTLSRIALTGTAADSITVVAPGSKGIRERWYDLCTLGIRQRALTAVTVEGLTEGTDFWVDLTLGRIKFASSVTGPHVPSLTGPAITSADDAFQLGIIPLSSPVKKGYGRLVIYDQMAEEKVALEHVDFSCEVMAEGSGEIAANWADINIKVKVTDTVGTVMVRSGNL